MDGAGLPGADPGRAASDGTTRAEPQAGPDAAGPEAAGPETAGLPGADPGRAASDGATRAEPQAGRETAGPEAAGPEAADRGGPAAPWLNEREMAAWLAFLEVSHLLDRAVEQQLRKDAGLSHAQYEILTRLSAADDGQLRMSELADSVIVSRSGLTYQVTQLEKAGLVRREKCPGDDRGVFAVITVSGRAALERAAPGHVRTVRDYLIDALTPAQREAVTAGLDSARARLRAPAAQPETGPLEAR